MIEEVLRELNCAVSFMLTAMNCIEKHKSKAINASLDTRKVKFLAWRTANNFQDRTEHELRTIIASLLGIKYHFSSESFHCVLLWDVVNHTKEKNKVINSDSKDEGIVIDNENKANEDE